MKTQPEVTVIIVSFNTCEQTLECIRSVVKHSKSENIELIVVDNNSQDNSAGKISREFPQVNLIRNHTNVGFGAANNQAMKVAKGKYFLLLNSDTLFTQNSISKVKALFESNGDVSIVGCKLLNVDSTLQPSCGYLPSLWRLFLMATFIDDIPGVKRFIHAYHQTDSFWYSMQHEVDWVTGAFMFIRANVYSSTGGFDERMFMYAEEVEWQIRTKSLHFKTIYDPSTEIIHHKMFSSQNNPQLPFISEFKGLQYIYRKHTSRWQQITLSAILKLAVAVRWFAYTLLPGKRVQKEIYARALEQI